MYFRYYMYFRYSVYIYMCIYKYVCIYIYVQTYIYTYICLNMQLSHLNYVRGKMINFLFNTILKKPPILYYLIIFTACSGAEMETVHLAGFWQKYDLL